MYISYLWLGIASFTLVMELGHPGLFLFLSFSLGALGALSIAFFEVSLSYQLITFICCTIIAWVLLRHCIRIQKTGYASSVHTLIGAQGFVTKRITKQHPGHVRIKNEEWLARASHDTTLDVGTPIQVVRVERTTVIVSPTHI